MGEVLRSSQLKGMVAEERITRGLEEVEVEKACKPSRSSLTAVEKGKDSCERQEDTARTFRGNLRADAKNIGNLAEAFAELDMEQRRKNIGI